MLHHGEWDHSKESARRRPQTRYNPAALSAISANEGVPSTFVYGVHNVKYDTIETASIAQEDLLDSDSELEFEADSSDDASSELGRQSYFASDDTPSEATQSLSEPEFRQALGSFWDHVAKEVEEEEKARANKDIDACACPVAYHLPRGAEVKLDMQTSLEAKAPPRRRSLSSHRSFADSSSLSRFSSVSPTYASTPRSLSRSVSRGTSAHQHAHHHQHYHHSLSSRPVVMQSPHQRHRSCSISDSYDNSHSSRQNSFLHHHSSNNHHQRTYSEDVQPNPPTHPLSARNLRSASIHHLHRHQSFPTPQRSPLAAIPRPKSRNDLPVSSISSDSPSPVLRALSLGTTPQLHFSRLTASASNQSPPKPSSSKQSPAKMHIKQSPVKMRSPVRASPHNLASDSSPSPKFSSQNSMQFSSPQKRTPQKSTPHKSTPPRGTPPRGTPPRHSPQKQPYKSPVKSFSQSSPEKRNSLPQSVENQSVPLRYLKTTPQTSPQKLFLHASPTKQIGSSSPQKIFQHQGSPQKMSPQKLFHQESPPKISPQKLFQTQSSSQKFSPQKLFQNGSPNKHDFTQRPLIQGSPQKRSSVSATSIIRQESPQKPVPQIPRTTPPDSRSPSKVTPVTSRLSPQKVMTPSQLTSQKQSPQKFSSQDFSPQKSPSRSSFKSIIPVGLHAPLRTASLHDVYVPPRFYTSSEFIQPQHFQNPQLLPSASPSKLPSAPTTSASSGMKEILKTHEIRDVLPAPRAVLKKARSGLLPRASEGLEHTEKQSWWRRSLGKSKDQQRNSLPIPEAKVDVTPPLWKRLVNNSKTSQKANQSERLSSTTPVRVAPLVHTEHLNAAQKGQLNSFFANAVLP